MVETAYDIPGAPGLALLADLHGRPYGPAVESLKRRRPGLICIAGDILDASRPMGGMSPLAAQPAVLPFLEQCAAVAPTYLALGNHERWLNGEDLETLRGTGVTLLDNAWTERDGLVIGGLTSGACMKYRRFRASLPETVTKRYPTLKDPDAWSDAPDTSWLADFAAAPGYRLLICHHPEYFPLVPEGVELVLSGHAHGGQWRFYNPFRRQWQGVFAPGQGLWPKVTKGVYEGRLVVSAGLANTASPVPRILNPAEVVYL